MLKVLNVFNIVSMAEAFFDGQYKYLSDNGFDIYLMAQENVSTEEFIRRNGIKFKGIDIPRSISVAKDIRSLRVIKNAIREIDPEIVIGHSPKGALLAMLAARMTNVRTRVYYRHGYIYTTMKGLKRLLFKWVEKTVASLATDIVNVSPSIGKIAVEERINPDGKQRCLGAGTCGGIDARTRFNPDLIDSDKKESISRRLKINPKDYVIGFCGRICKEKGIEELVAGFEMLKKRREGESLKLMLVGPYDERDVLSDQTRKLIESDPSIILTGYVKDGLQYYYSLMDVFVLPSYREGFGMSVIEASAMEIPVIVSKVHGCVDSIVEGVTGEYVGISPEAICDKLDSFISTPDVVKYGKAGRKDVLEKYDHQVIWPEVLSFYESLADRK